MYCTKCGKEINNGTLCDSCSSVATTATTSPKVNKSVAIKLFVFGLLGFIPLISLTTDIISMSFSSRYLSDISEGFSFYSFITTITEFEYLRGTSGHIFLSMLLMLIAGIKLLSSSINALLWCDNSKKIKKGYTNLYKWCEGYGILSLIAAGICWTGHDSALSKYFMSDLFTVTIPTPFIILAIFSFVLGVVIKLCYKKDENHLFN